MSLVITDKNMNEPVTVMEHHVNRLRYGIKELRESPAWEYDRENRRQNGNTMRALWKFIQTGEVIADYAQRALLALNAGTIAMRASAMNAKGEIYDVSFSLDPTRSYTYRARKDQVVPYTKPGLLHDKRKTIVENEYELWRLQQFCEATLQKRANEAVVQIHSIPLMLAWHRDNKSGVISRIRGVNIDNNYNSFDVERPNYRRRHFAVPASKLSAEYLQKRAAAFCDSARLIGEQAVLQASYENKPRQNALVAVLSDVSMMIVACYERVQWFTNCILKDAAIYKGFQRVAGKVVQPEAITMRYADGVTLYSGRHATSVYKHEQVKYDMVRHLVAKGAMTLDIPRMQFYAPNERHEDKLRADIEHAKKVWSVGRKFLRDNLDNDVRGIFRGYSRS